MLRSTLALVLLLIPVMLDAQPARETLLRDLRYDNDAVRPKFVTVTPDQLKSQTTAGLLEIDDGVMAVHCVEIELPKGANSHYAFVEFEPPTVRGSGGAVIEIERQSGMLNPTRNSFVHRLLARGGDEPAKFSTVSGRTIARVPLTVETRTIRNTDPTSLAKLGATIDGPFVRYRRELIPEETSSFADFRPVRAYNAEGQALEHEGTYPDRVNGAGYEMVAFYGAPATAEIDVAGETAILTIDYALTLGNGKATKVRKTLEAAGPRDAEGAAREASAPAKRYTAADVEKLHAAAVNNDVKVISGLLEAGVPVDAKGESGMTALHVAARTGRVNALDALLAAGANVNAVDSNGLTALFGLGARCNQAATETAAKLIAKGADVNAKGKSQLSPLGLAKSMNCTEIVTLLTKAGAR